MFYDHVTFQCYLSGITVWVSCTNLHGLIQAGPNDLMFYTDNDNVQGQCMKKELTFQMVEIIDC